MKAVAVSSILIVDDDEGLRESLRDVLECEGFKVWTADNGQTALQILENDELPSVIVMDLLMPVLDGYEFRKIQLERPKIAQIPVIFLTGLGETQDHITLLKDCQIISKPVSLDLLIERVKSVSHQLAS